MSTLEPLDALEAIIWELCPSLRNVRVVIQDLDQPHARATSITFHKEPVVSLPAEDLPIPVVRVQVPASLPLARTKLTPADFEMLVLIEHEPGLKGDVIARRIGVADVTARRRLGRLVRGGWISSSHHDGYAITDQGKKALEAFRS